LSHPTLDGNGVKAIPGRFKYPILVHSTIEKKEKYSQIAKWGTPKKYLKKELPLDFSKAPSAKLSTLNTCLPKNNVDKNSTFQKNEHFLRC